MSKEVKNQRSGKRHMVVQYSNTNKFMQWVTKENNNESWLHFKQCSKTLTRIVLYEPSNNSMNSGSSQ